MAMRAQTSSKDEAFGIFEISETVIWGQLYASRLPIPDGFLVVWEGPAYRPHSLGDGSKCCRGKGLKTVSIAATRTSVVQALLVFYPLLACVACVASII